MQIFKTAASTIDTRLYFSTKIVLESCEDFRIDTMKWKVTTYKNNRVSKYLFRSKFTLIKRCIKIPEFNWRMHMIYMYVQRRYIYLAQVFSA